MSSGDGRLSVAITGSTGQVGSRVAQQLPAQGQALVLVVRDAARAPRLDNAEVRIASGYADTAAMTEAFRGCASVFLVSGRESAHRVGEHASAVKAAVAAGVERIVYLSFQGAGPNCTFTFGRDHWHTEQLIRSTGMDFTFVRDSFYLAALAAMCGPDGVIRGPGGAGAVAAVDHEDVASVVTAVLSSRDYDGQTLDVTGPEAITLSGAAELLAAAAGRPVSYMAETHAEAVESRARFGAPDFEVLGWVSSYEAIANGEVAEVTDTVHRLTDHQPINFAKYLSQHPESYAPLLSSPPPRR